MAMANMYNYQKPKMMPKKIMDANKSSKINEVKRRESTKQDHYLEQKILAAKPEELTLMLYDGIVRFIKQAMLYNDQKNIEKTNYSIQRAEAIVNELNATLDMAFDVSTNLELMYDYIKRRLLDANLLKDSKVLEEVLGYAEELRDTWKQAMVLAK